MLENQWGSVTPTDFQWNASLAACSSQVKDSTRLNFNFQREPSDSERIILVRGHKKTFLENLCYGEEKFLISWLKFETRYMIYGAGL